MLKATQVGHILGDSGAEVLITSADRLSQLALVLPNTLVAHVIVVGDAVPDRAASWQIHSWAGGQATTADPGRTPVIDIDPAAILYTSGSTGKPKGVVLSHRNLIVGAESVSSYLGNTSDDVILSVLPLSFDAGLSQVTTAFSVGAHCVLMNYLLPRDVPKLCERYGVTGLTCVPPLWLQLADVPWPEATARRLRYWANTGGRMPRATLESTAGHLHGGRPLPDVRTHGGVPLDLSGPRGNRPASGFDRQSHPQCRDPRAPSGRDSRAGPARRANLCTAAHSWRSATGTTRCAPQNTFAPCAIPDRSGAHPKTRSGRGTPW